MMEVSDVKPKRRGRGPGKKPSLFCTSIRLDRHVLEFFKEHHSYNKQAAMRKVLTDYVNEQLKLKEPQHGTQETYDE